MLSEDDSGVPLFGVLVYLSRCILVLCLLFLSWHFVNFGCWLCRGFAL